MSTVLEPVEQDRGADDFDVRTTHSDATRANLRVRGTLDASSAALLAEVIAGHVRARRRFVRLDVIGLSIADADAVAVIVEAHQRLLAVRGTLILTGVTDAVRSALASAYPGQQLFLVQPTAFELGESGR